LQVRRRRECQSCGERYTTFESAELVMPHVVKRDGRREPFQRDKLLQGIRIAFIKRPIPQRDLDRIADAIRLRAVHQARQEVTSVEIGEWTLEQIRRVDAVAALRFASVFRALEGVEELQRELVAIRDAPTGGTEDPGEQPRLPLVDAGEAGRRREAPPAPPETAHG
jgi:transcriptional repressor NrdR